MMTEIGIEMLCAAVIRQAFADLRSRDKRARESAHEFFRKRLFEAWSDRDWVPWYEEYLRTHPVKERVKHQANEGLRDYMYEWPRVSMTAIAEACGLSQTKVFKMFSVEMGAEMRMAMRIIVDAIKEEKRNVRRRCKDAETVGY